MRPLKFRWYFLVLAIALLAFNVPILYRDIRKRSAKNTLMEKYGIEIDKSSMYETRLVIDSAIDFRSLREVIPIIKTTNEKIDTLVIKNCNHLQDLSGISEIKSLIKVFIVNCDKLESISELSGLRNLQTIQLYYCEKIKAPNGLKDLPSLSTITFDECHELVSIGELNELPQIRSIGVYRCSKIQNINNLKNMKNINTIAFRDCESLVNIDAIKNMPLLNHVSIMNCNNLKKFARLTKRDKFEEFEIEVHGDSNVWEGHEYITHLSITDCNSLTSLKSIGKLLHVVNLTIDNCANLKNLSDLNSLYRLQSFHLTDCENIDFGTMYQSHVESLHITKNSNLKTLDLTNRFSDLRVLYIESFDKLESVKGLNTLERLKSINFVNCENLTKLGDLKKHPSFQKLDIRIQGCDKIPQEEFEPIENEIPEPEIKK